MLKINQFYWNLYKESPEGKKTIEKFEKASNDDFSIDDSIRMLEYFDPEWFLNIDENEVQWLFREAKHIANEWTFDNTKSMRNNAEEWMESSFDGDFGVAIQYIAPLSFFLYKKNPSYFIPYMFLLRYNYIRQILEDYDLDIKEVPGKANVRDRCFYYLDICDALSKFRELNDNMTAPELCAFLYDMERKQYDASYSKDITPFPQVWLTGGKKSEKESREEKMFWHANAETKKGDIIVFYETGQTYIKENKSCITGIWIAQTDGISDPLFYYYGQVIIGNEIKIKPIPFKVLASDPRTNKLPRLGAHFLGISGDAVSTKIYEGLLELIEERDPSFDRGRLPQLHEPYNAKVKYDERGDMKPEKWVEVYLIKEMLEKMGWGIPEVDYRRQVHLQLGRAKIEGEKTQDGRTDFSLFPFGRQLKCADVLIEAKAPGEMDGKDIEKAFWQAESYASRQYANLIILADGDKVLLFPKSKDGTFKYSNNPESFTWNEIFSNTDDKFTKLRKIILSYRKHGK
jgi:hypothetical protein